MKSIIKKIIAILGGVIVLLIIALFITAKVNDRSIWAQLGAISGTMTRTFGNNSKYRIKVDGVLDQDGNIAAQGKTIQITAKVFGGSSLGVIGTLKDGKLDIVLPPLSNADASGELISFNNSELELSNITNNDDYLDFWFFKEPTEYKGRRSLKGWNFVTAVDDVLYARLRHVPEDYKWVYYGE